MPTVFKHDDTITVGDLVKGRADICKTDLMVLGPVDTFTGKVIAVKRCEPRHRNQCDHPGNRKCRDTVAHVKRDDGVRGAGEEGAWIVGVQFCRKIDGRENAKGI